MRNEGLFQLLVAKMNEVNMVPPQSLGPLTFWYKRLIPRFKFYPWKSTLVLSLLAALILYFLLGVTLVSITSLLQFGF